MEVEQEKSPDIRSQIQDAAMERFGRFGFGKTTMSEIARDCEMSAGNLYRYFENKTEIGAACAKRCMGESEEEVRKVLKAPGMTAGQRLEAFILNKLRFMHVHFADHPTLLELVLHITENRFDLVAAHWGKLQSMVAEILAEGNRTGEFEVDDILKTAEAFLLANYKFIAPRNMAGYTLETLEQEAHEVLSLLIKALKKG